MWRAFDMREPIGDWRHDLGAGVVASTLVNVKRGKNTPAFAPVDFMPYAQRPKKNLAADLRSMLKGVGKGKKK